MIVPATKENIAKAAEAIRQGQVVAFPTETVYGLGASAYNSAAIDKVFAIKHRPSYNPLIVHLSSADDLDQAVELPQSARVQERLSRVIQFWPGPLSIVLPKKSTIAPRVSAGLDTVAVRVPDHAVARALIKACGVPVAAPSANLFSTVSPTTASHVYESLGDAIDIVLDGGPCRVGLESTVITILEDKVRILRPGGITREELEAALEPGDLLPPHEVVKLASIPTEQPLLAPGMLAQHYSPKTRLLFRDQLAQLPSHKRIGLISFRELSAEDLAQNFASTWVLSKDGDLEEVAAKLFAALRQMDTLGLDIILVDSCPEDGLGYAIMDRLRRAVTQPQFKE